MIEIIIALLLALGINLDREQITVVDQTTGISFGVGTGSGSSNAEIDNPKVFILLQDDSGKYYLERR
ncbi:MAG: hypothetical protein KBB64_13300 [Bacteroidia bacterium]|nr:hypothetical protein [Bacteroidia bacterium]